MTSDKTNVSLLADLFIKKGFRDIVISPGSRNAPIVIAFAGNKKIRALSVTDERSAAFFALGMADATKNTVAIACTSGSAVLNYAPAIAEAYYRKVPLLILTADRPPELIDQGDGQTIRQKDVYRNYIKKSFELPVVVNDPATFQIAEEVINRALDETRFPEPGPVHINIPLREPLYGSTGELPDGKIRTTVKPLQGMDDGQLDRVAGLWNLAERIMIIAGQMEPDQVLDRRLAALSRLGHVAVLTETTSNLMAGKYIGCIDNVVSVIADKASENFRPDLLVSLGGQVISKMVKRYLRLHPPKWHVHISPSEEQMDTYFSLTEVIADRPSEFFRRIHDRIETTRGDFGLLWKKMDEQVSARRDAYLEKAPYSDLKVFEYLLNNIPIPSVLHLGNSTPVRYAQLFGQKKGFLYRSNRGVSGIDGQVSTAAGNAFADSSELHTIITGDLGFLYDTNALMNHHLTPNLRIIVINNGGGGIFRFISGPDASEYLETFFEARHRWTAERIAGAYDVSYFRADNLEQLEKQLKIFYSAPRSRPALLEIFTPGEVSAMVLKDYFKSLKT